VPTVAEAGTTNEVAQNPDESSDAVAVSVCSALDEGVSDTFVWSELAGHAVTEATPIDDPAGPDPGDATSDPVKDSTFCDSEPLLAAKRLSPE
jgi:hypothetical protein